MSDQNHQNIPESPVPPREEEKQEAGNITQNSPFLRKLDNFWYHHKWTVIVVTFFVVVAIVCTVQFVTRPQYDTSMAIATNYRMNSAEYLDFQNLITRISPNDFNGDGKIQINVVIYEFYSEDEIEEAREQYARPNADGETDRFQINLQYNTSEYNGFNQYTLTGESSVYIVSPTLYARLADNDRLMKLADLYPDGNLPAGARTDGIGINLKETDFYKYNPAAQVIPETAILCFHRPTIGGKSSDETVYEQEKIFFHAIADYRVEED